MFPKTVIIITGPTASGKTSLSIELARHFNTSIISADSRQCFRELNIGVAKPDPSQLQEIKHYFINSHSVHEEVNAGVFESLATIWCEEIFAHTDTVIMCGGTGLYIKAFRNGLDEIPAVDQKIRSDITHAYNKNGLDWLQHAIRDADPLFYTSGEMKNPQRMMRALEVKLSSGLSILSFRSRQKKQHSFRIFEFGIRLPRKELYSRIDGRVDSMIESGLPDEVKSLMPFQHLNALQTVGYAELFDHFNGKLSLNESIALIKQHTRHYAKRQLTWLNKNENIIWLEDDFLNQILGLCDNTETERP